MARVDVLREVKSGDVGESQLCFHWCRYRLDDGSIQYGHHFVWRRQDDGSIQAARGQARIPSFAWATELMDKASKAGWGDRNGDQMELAAERLRATGWVVELGNGYVGWPDRGAAHRGSLTEQGSKDAKIIHEWSH